MTLINQQDKIDKAIKLLTENGFYIIKRRIKKPVKKHLLNDDLKITIGKEIALGATLKETAKKYNITQYRAEDCVRTLLYSLDIPEDEFSRLLFDENMGHIRIIRHVYKINT